MAGVSRLQYTTEMRMIRVMCSGRVDMSFVLRAFSKGLDGVFIGACHLNECNYITHGNYQAQNMVLLVKKIMEHIGINPGRLRLQHVSGAEGNLFAESTNEFVQQIKDLGPLGQADGEVSRVEMKARLAEVMKLVPYIKVEKREKLSARLTTPEDCDAHFTLEEVSDLLTNVASYWIDPEKCQACMTCARRCPADAIISVKGEVHIVEQDKCIKCGTCYAVCPPRFAAATRLVGKPVPPPPPEGERAVIRKKKEA